MKKCLLKRALAPLFRNGLSIWFSVTLHGHCRHSQVSGIIRLHQPTHPFRKLLWALALLVLGMVLFYLFLKHTQGSIAQRIKKFIRGLKEGFSVSWKCNKRAFIFQSLLIWGLYLLSFYTATRRCQNSRHRPPYSDHHFCGRQFHFCLYQQRVGYYPVGDCRHLVHLWHSRDGGQCPGVDVWTSNITGTSFYLVSWVLCCCPYWIKRTWPLLQPCCLQNWLSCLSQTWPYEVILYLHFMCFIASTVLGQSKIIYEEFASFKLEETRRLKIQLPRDYEATSKNPIHRGGIGRQLPFWTRGRKRGLFWLLGRHARSHRGGHHASDKRYEDCSYDDSNFMPDEKGLPFLNSLVWNYSPTLMPTTVRPSLPLPWLLILPPATSITTSSRIRHSSMGTFVWVPTWHPWWTNAFPSVSPTFNRNCSITWLRVPTTSRTIWMISVALDKVWRRSKRYLYVLFR